MPNHLVSAFIIGCIVLVVAALGFMAKWYMKSVKESNDEVKASNKELSTVLGRLHELILGMKGDQELHSFRLGVVERDVAEIKNSRAFGRRDTDICPDPNCPVLARAAAEGREPHPRHHAGDQP